jgi:hypothetical protein
MAQIKILKINETNGGYRQVNPTGVVDQVTIPGIVIGDTGATVDMGGNQVVNSATPTTDTALATKAYVDGVATGLSWKEPASVYKMISDSDQSGTDPAAPSSGDAYVVSNWATQRDGDIVEYDGSAWNMIVANSGGSVPNGTRVVINGTAAGTFSTHMLKIAEYNSGWFFNYPDNGDALLINGQDSIYENKGYVFDASTVVDEWVQFTDTATVNAGEGLTKTGLVLSVNTGEGITISADNVTAVPYHGISIDSNGIQVKEGTGTSVDTNGVHVNTYHGLSVDANGVQVDIASGVTADSNGLHVKVYHGLSVDTNGVQVNTASGVTADADGLHAVGYHGISVDSNGIQANPASGVSVDTNGIHAVGYHGISVDTNGIQIDAASGITVDANGLHVDLDANSGLSLDADGLSINYNSADNYVSVNGSGELITKGLPSSFYIDGTATDGTYVTASNLDTLTDGSNADALHVHSSSQNILVANNTFSPGDPVYIAGVTTGTNGYVEIGDASADISSHILGVVSSTVTTTGANANIRGNGIVENALTGATENTPYYLAAGGAGLTATMPSSVGDHLWLIGYSINSTDLFVNMTYWGQR